MTKLTTEEQIDRLLDRLPFQRIKRLEAENAALRTEVEKSRVIIEALKGQLAGKPSNPPKTGRKPTALVKGPRDDTT